MITNFEKITEQLNSTEIDYVDPLVEYLERHSSPEQPKKSYEVVSYMQDELGYDDFKGVKLRKIVNLLRRNGYTPVIATSKGYFISNDKEELKKQIESLENRADAIMESADGLRNFVS